LKPIEIRRESSSQALSAIQSKKPASSPGLEGTRHGVGEKGFRADCIRSANSKIFSAAFPIGLGLRRFAPLEDSAALAAAEIEKNDLPGGKLFSKAASSLQETMLISFVGT